MEKFMPAGHRAALQEGMKEKAAEFIAAGAEIYQGEAPKGLKLDH